MKNAPDTYEWENKGRYRGYVNKGQNAARTKLFSLLSKHRYEKRSQK